MDKQNTTILDVARLAGVSKGTVDRVLHNRGEVSAKSAEKVREAVRQLNYEPNLYASLLASRKECTIACIIPSHHPGEYWEKIHQGLELGHSDVASMGVNVRIFIYDQYNPKSFRASLQGSSCLRCSRWKRHLLSVSSRKTTSPTCTWIRALRTTTILPT